MGRLKRFALGVISWLLVHSHLANADGIAQVYADSIDVRSISASSNISIGPARLNELSATDEISKRMLFLNIFSSSPNALINASMDNAMQSVGGRITSVAQVSTGKRLTGFIPLSKSGDSFGIDIKIANGPSNLATTVVTGCSKKFFSSSPSLPSQCSECPPNTESMGFISSECYCSSGYYSGSDAECLPCPINGLCRGGPNATVEVARNGFAVVEGDANGALVAVPCPNKEACVKGTTGCVTGYTGSLCSQCSSGYYKAGPVCRECSLGNAPFIITAVVASIVVYIVFMGVTWLWERSASLSIIVFFLQDLAFLSIVEVQLPEATRLLLHQISFFNYNWELAQSECAFGQVPWYLSTVLILGMPVIFLFMDCLVTGSGILVTIVRQRLNKPKLIEWSKWAYDIRPKNYLCFLHLSFFPFVLSSFSLFDCRSAGILSYVQYNTAAMCESHGPVGFVWLGIISTLIYGLGIPVATYYLVHRSSPPKPVSEPTFELTETGLSEKIKASSSLENSSADNRNLITKNQGGISLVSDPKRLLFTYVRRYGMIVLAVFHPENGVTSVQPLCIACWLFVVSFLQFYGVRRSQPRARNLIAIVEGLFIMWIHAAILLAVGVHFRYLYDDSYPLTVKSGGSVPLFNVLWWWILIGIILGALVFVVEIGYSALRTKGFIPDIFEVKEKEPESEPSTPSGLGPNVNEQTLRFTKSVFGMSNASQSTLPRKVGEIEQSSVKSEEKTIPTATSIQKRETSGTIPSYSEQEAESVRAEASLGIDTTAIVSPGPETETTLANENESSIPASCLDPTKEESVKDNDDTLTASKGSSKRSLVVEKENKNEELHKQSTNLEMQKLEEIPVVESANVQEQKVTEPISESLLRPHHILLVRR